MRELSTCDVASTNGDASKGEQGEGAMAHAHGAVVRY